MLLASVSNDKRFKQVAEEDVKEELGTMCEALDRIEAKGIEKGIKEGEERVVKLMQALIGL